MLIIEPASFPESLWQCGEYGRESTRCNHINIEFVSNSRVGTIVANFIEHCTFQFVACCVVDCFIQGIYLSFTLIKLFQTMVNDHESIDTDHNRVNKLAMNNSLLSSKLPASSTTSLSSFYDKLSTSWFGSS